MSGRRKMSTSLPTALPIDVTFTGEGYDDDFENNASSRTLASTANSYRFENGRRYHSYREGSYWGPNDERDKYHQAVTHHLYCLALRDKFFLAPLSKPRNVLDIGTGTGLWAMDLADQYPETNVIGTDLSPEWGPVVQPNLRFEIDDCCSEWTYPPNNFDFIHARGLYGSVSDLPRFYQECYSHLVPGGYIEQAEIGVEPFCDDGTLSADSVFHEWYRIASVYQGKLNKQFTLSDTMKDAIAKAGFVDVVEQRFKMPLGPWCSDQRMKEIGRWYRNFWESGMEGWLMAIATRHLGWKIEDIRSFLSKTKAAIDDWETHVYFKMVIVYGRKPL